MFLFLFLILSLGTLGAEPISNFAFYNLKEERIVLSNSLENFSEKDVLILNFTGSQCKPCKEQVPVLLNLTAQSNLSAVGKWKTHLWIVFVGDDFRTGKEYSDLLKLGGVAESLVDPLSSSYSQVKIKGVPTVFILNRNREILFRSEGYTPAGVASLKNFLSSFGK
ncbi:hypothetical protein EHQ76_19505 [Leptospira barantonii]|uniref:Thioredoxin domain-containing protein n=1 Tax=Leptospira barantonii TaxID=2023184 RepID=A0A5F2AXR8_9LEPT|nr:thioredoxin family protein [Leptospira barantonii]TGL92759.1 hypothetical protein EHQ76_19505 [Leptospira barantonii]